MFIKIQCGNLRFELQADREHIDTYCVIRNKMWKFSREFPKLYKCPSCNKKTERNERITVFCQDCHDNFVSTWEKKIL